MISEEEIQRIATKLQTSEINVRREYFQHLFLSYFYQNPAADDCFFKGGTALRLLYQSPRFSEDLDFDCSSINYKNIEDLLEETLNQIEKENIGFKLKEAKQTSGGFLAIVAFEAYQQPIDIRLEISLREGKKKGEIVSITKNDYVPSYNIVAVTQEQLIAGKIAALLSRKKPRDFYDLYYILRSNLLQPEKKELLPTALKFLKESDINFESELKQFLPKSHWAIIRDFKSVLEREIRKYI